jgi:3'-phosphoadenosine 5'-phosphosulfate sulfotransferase (PAPS reductase)/FAD synthetase
MRRTIVRNPVKLEDRAINAFDYLIIDHGFTFEELAALADRMTRTETKAKKYIFFVELWQDARREGLKLARATSNFFELCKYYTEEQAADVLNEIAKCRKALRRKQEKKKAKK